MMKKGPGKPVRTGMPVNKNEKLRAEKKMGAVGNTKYETGGTNRSKTVVVTKNKPNPKANPRKK